MARRGTIHFSGVMAMAKTACMSGVPLAGDGGAVLEMTVKESMREPRPVPEPSGKRALWMGKFLQPKVAISEDAFVCINIDIYNNLMVCSRDVGDVGPHELLLPPDCERDRKFH